MQTHSPVAVVYMNNKVKGRFSPSEKSHLLHSSVFLLMLGYSPDYYLERQESNEVHLHVDKLKKHGILWKLFSLAVYLKCDTLSNI